MDLFLQIDSNPNCETVDGMMYQALEAPRPVRRIRVARGGRETWCWVTGVEPSVADAAMPRWVPAVAQKITDSGAGVAYAISGGRWGIRLQPDTGASPTWNLAAAGQWGEPYKIYGELVDLDMESAI